MVEKSLEIPAVDGLQASKTRKAWTAPLVISATGANGAAKTDTNSPPERHLATSTNCAS
jgi:hypothetical protein